MIVEPSADIRSLVSFIAQTVAALEQFDFTRQEAIFINLTLIKNAGDSDE